MVTIPNLSMWLATGNNPVLTTELVRRTIRIRLDPKMARPWERKEFQHADLSPWVKANRGELVWAVLSLIQAWITAGRPKSDKTLGKFTSWAEVIGGILECSGIEDFLGNTDEMYTHADEEVSEWEALVTQWWDDWKGAHKLTRDVFRMAIDEDLLLSVRGSGTDQSQKVRLGKALAQMRDRPIERWRILSGKDGHSKSPTYRLE